MSKHKISDFLLVFGSSIGCIQAVNVDKKVLHCLYFWNAVYGISIEISAETFNAKLQKIESAFFKCICTKIFVGKLKEVYLFF